MLSGGLSKERIVILVLGGLLLLGGGLYRFSGDLTLPFGNDEKIHLSARKIAKYRAIVKERGNLEKVFSRSSFSFLLKLIPVRCSNLSIDLIECLNCQRQSFQFEILDFSSILLAIDCCSLLKIDIIIIVSIETKIAI